MEAENFWCLRLLFAHQESPNSGYIEEVLRKGSVEHLNAPFTISYFVLCSSNPCLLGGDGSRSDLLVDQKSHLVRRILKGQHQLFSHQQCLKIKINTQFIFSSLVNNHQPPEKARRRCRQCKPSATATLHPGSDWQC